jgi:recombinational DNA repair protein (RecF pathway)
MTNHAQLAWSLPETCSHCLNEIEKCAVYVALGSGDTRTAISKLVKAAARQQLTLSTDVAAALRAWWVAQDFSAETTKHIATLVKQLTTQHEPRPSLTSPQLSVERKYLLPNRTMRASSLTTKMPSVARD